MLKKRGELVLNQAVVFAVIIFSAIILIPFYTLLANTADYEHERISCLANAIVRDNIFSVVKDNLYDLDCGRVAFIIRNSEIIYEKNDIINGELKKEEKSVQKISPKDLSNEVYSFIGKQVVSTWYSLGGGSLGIADTVGDNQCVIASEIRFDIDKSDKVDFSFNVDDFYKYIEEHKINKKNDKDYMINFLKGDNGKIAFYIPESFNYVSIKGFDEPLFVVYIESDKKKIHSDSEYNVFLATMDDISEECDRIIT